jgi:hypothetical protein
MWEWQFEIPLDDGTVQPVNGLTSQTVTGGSASKKQSTAYGYRTALHGRSPRTTSLARPA